MTVPFLQDSTFTGLISTQNYGTSQQWYEAFTNLTAFLETSSVNVTNTTFDGLTALKANNQLIPGEYYQINDFELTWRSISYNESATDRVKTSGVIEPLLVFAVSVSGISPIAYSILHPTDIIYYDIDSQTSTGWGDFPGPGDTIPNFKGWITRRIDQVRNIDIGWDWRYIKVNCCKFNVDTLPLHDPGATYNKKSIVRTSAGKIYYSIRDNNINNDVSNIGWWLPFSDETEANIYYPTNEISYGMGYTFNSVLGQYDTPARTLTPILSTRTQLPTFDNANSAGLANIKIASGFNNRIVSGISRNLQIGSNFNNNYICPYVGFGIGFENNSIGNSFTNNIIGASFSNNSVKDGFTNNVTVGYRVGIYPTNVQFCSIDNSCRNNHIGIQFINNILGDNFANNIIERNFTFNEIKTNFQQNYIGTSFNFNSFDNSCTNNSFETVIFNNRIGNQFQNNIVNTGFVYNTIQDACLNNLFGNNFAYNTIKNNFLNNNIGDESGLNVFGNNFTFNTINLFCISNIFGDDCSGNVFGQELDFNIIGSNFSSNTVGDDMTNNRIGNSFESNILGNGFKDVLAGDSITSINFTGATHVYNNYSKTIFINSNSELRLSYFNTTDQLVVTDLDS